MDKKQKEMIDNLTKNGETVLKVTSTILYSYPKGSVNNWKPKEVMEDWFNERHLHSSHATRDQYSKVIDNIEVFKPNKKLTSGTYEINAVIQEVEQSEALITPEKEGILNIEFSIYCSYQENDKILKKIIDMLNNNLQGYTIIHSTGYWMGEEEKSLQIVILGAINDLEKIRQLCERINHIADQKTTLLTYDTIGDTEFIYTRNRKIQMITGIKE